MLKHDPSSLMKRTRELISKSQALCDRSRRTMNESKRPEARLGIPRPKSDQRRKRLPKNNSCYHPQSALFQVSSFPIRATHEI